ncbi:PREDICTED: uncharacterized abhydrolase domain-containing protein DDB_G0269086-like, partial [Rhagoletis zephyria]|uniref:uncharacterized abhydrolase domain-containing protein DDB_G0269086-like n=1 Tax=Rhagoletis zephyria TaxID=28612 RepID=UPI000811AA6A
MDIIPDEVELFFENLNVSMHAIVFTSIIAIFWSFTKVLTSFVNSSRKQGELRDITCQVQRKIFYFEAEKDKVKEEAQTAKEMLQVREVELRQLGLRKSQLEQENEALKAERNRYTSEIESLRGRASEASQNSSRLNTTLDDLTRLQNEKRDLELLNEDLEEKVTRLEGEKATLEGTVESLTEKNKKLTAKSKEMAAEAETLLGRLKEAEQSCALLQAETASLQSTKIALHEELRNLKDDLLAAEERRGELTETVQLQTAALADAQSKLTALVGELDGKNADLASMRQLLSQLNKEVVSQKGRAEAAVAAAAQRRRLSSQRSTEQLQQQQLNGIEDSAAAAEAEAAAALDALNGNVGGDVEAPTTTTTTTSKKADEDKENEEEEEGGETTTSVSDLQDIVKLQLRLTATELERGALAAKVKSLEAALESSRAELAALQRSNASLKAATEAAERERDKAVTGLEVLSKHFKDKELEFGREIGVQL